MCFKFYKTAPKQTTSFGLLNVGFAHITDLDVCVLETRGFSCSLLLHREERERTVTAVDSTDALQDLW